MSDVVNHDAQVETGADDSGPPIILEMAEGADETQVEENAGEPIDEQGDVGEAESSNGEEGEEGHEAAAPVEEGADWSQLTKKQAKSQLSKAEYKQWKKSHGKKKNAKKEKKKDKKGSPSKEKKKKGDKKGKDKRKDSSDDQPVKKRRKEAPVADEAVAGGEDGVVPQNVARRRQTAKPGKPKLDVRALQEEAENTVFLMRTARENDASAAKNGQPPVFRLKIRDAAVAVIRRVALHAHLVAAGVLDELTYWLCDPKTHVLAPLDLRVAALELLLTFEFEGVRSTRRRHQDEEKMGHQYEGISLEILKKSSIGKAVNAIRNSSVVPKPQQAAATMLLERMCRAFRGEDDEPSSKKRLLWPSMEDPTIASPFEHVKTQTEAFMSRSNKLDPQDPNSYLKMPPRRPKRSYITGLAHVGRSPMHDD